MLETRVDAIYGFLKALAVSPSCIEDAYRYYLFEHMYLFNGEAIIVGFALVS